ncbi:MAG: PCRF domain-containing protein, partial [Chloroflexota bacterium]
MIDRLKEIERRFDELGELMGQPEVLADLPLLQRYAREHADLREVVGQYRELTRIEAEMADAQSWLDGGDSDEDLREMACDTVT